MSKFQCPICDKKFKRKENFKYHLSKKFPCVRINRHEENNFKTYDCQVCNKKYTTNHNLLKHMKKNHNLVPDEIITKHICNRCEHYYSSNSNLIRHQIKCLIQ